MNFTIKLKKRINSWALRFAQWLGITRELDNQIKYLKEENYLLGWGMDNVKSSLGEKLRAAEFRADNWERFAKRLQERNNSHQ